MHIIKDFNINSRSKKNKIYTHTHRGLNAQFRYMFIRSKNLFVYFKNCKHENMQNIYIKSTTKKKHNEKNIKCDYYITRLDGYIYNSNIHM